MNAKAKIEISQEALAVAAKNAAEAGFATAGEYIEAILLEDRDELDAIAQQPWFQKKIEEGFGVTHCRRVDARTHFAARPAGY